jgi:DNA-binding HxlR family transcriptional regulator
MDLPRSPASRETRRVESYGDYCPVARAAEVFATRWTPPIVRNMVLGCRTFTEIHDGVPGMSRTLLTQRLRMLEHHRIVQRVPRAEGRGTDYVLTAAGEELAPVCDALGRWGERWLEMAPLDYDAGTMLWSLSRKLAPEDLPDHRTVIRFEVTEPRQRYWLLAEPPRVELCRRPPGVAEDAIVEGSAEWLVKWQMGRIGLGDALHEGLIDIRGPAWIERLLVGWGARCTYGERTPRELAAGVA